MSGGHSPEAKKRQEMKYDARLAARGLRLVRFVVPIPLWEKFLAMRCGTESPNVVFTKLLEELTRDPV